jgi:hypothetical protein
MTTLFEPLTKPTAAQLNSLADAIETLEAAYSDAGRQFMAAEWGGSGSRWIFRHCFRWLLYDSSGQLEDLSGANDPVPLPDGEVPGAVVKDLSTIGWLSPEMLYRVTGCAWAMEQETI